MDREEELKNLIEKIDPDKKILMIQLFDDLIFMEKQLGQLKKYPFIKIHPKDFSKQKATPASKQYKEILQQYTNVIKILGGLLGDETGDGESELRKYLKRFKEMNR